MNRSETGKWEFTEQELAQQVAEAAERGKEAERTEARASRVYYDGNHRRLMIELRNRVLLGIPVDRIQGLAHATPSEIQKVQLEASGDAVRWDSLDLDFGVPGLVAGVLGTNAWMAELGRKGGSVQSEAKTVAARMNGLLGGRPARVGLQVRSGVGKAHIVTSSNLFGVITSPGIVVSVGAHFTPAYWGRYQKIVDLYKTTSALCPAGSLSGVLLSPPTQQTEAAFGHIGGKIPTYKAKGLTEAEKNADLALAA